MKWVKKVQYASMRSLVYLLIAFRCNVHILEDFQQSYMYLLQFTNVSQ